MDITVVANTLQAKEWRIEMPGKYAELEFDLVVTPKPIVRGNIKMREFRFLIKVLSTFDAKAALVWQTHYDILLKRATKGFLSAAEFPEFLLCLAAKEMTADAMLM